MTRKDDASDAAPEKITDSPETTEQETPTAIERLPVGEHVEEISENGKKVRRRGIYLLPNLCTTGALFSGFYAVVAAIHGEFDNAAIAVFVAMFFDGLDGRVARLTQTQSAFGVQYDSLSDMVSFGVAPALVMFTWALGQLGKVGWAIAFVYVAGAALRLARFNTQAGSSDQRFFTGLASPPAAALLAALVWTGTEYGYAGASVPGWLVVLAALATGFAGTLMVTNIPYRSFKGIDFKGRVPFVVFPAIVLVLAVVTIDPPRVLLAMASVYAVSGPLVWVWRLRRPRAVSS